MIIKITNIYYYNAAYLAGVVYTKKNLSTAPNWSSVLFFFFHFFFLIISGDFCHQLELWNNVEWNTSLTRLKI